MGVDQSKLDNELLLSASSGDFKRIQTWLRKGTNLYVKNQSGENVLHLTCMSPTCGEDRRKLIIYLLRISEGRLLSANIYGHLPTYMAATSRDIEFLETFLQSGYVHPTDRISLNHDLMGQAITLQDKAAVVHKESARFHKLIPQYSPE